MNASTTNQHLKIQLSKSLLGRPEKHRKVAKALGLTKMWDLAIHADTPTIRGMVRKIAHLLTVEVA
jgi:large subunit ribosomal protein L30